MSSRSSSSADEHTEEDSVHSDREEEAQTPASKADDDQSVQIQHITSPNGRYVHHGEVLGVGAVKTVYKAIDVELGTQVAWNELVVKTSQSDSVATLMKEVDLLRSLEHPNVLKTMDAWTQDESVIFITELMPGGTLRKLIKKMGGTGTGHSVRALRNWSKQILDALIYLHERHIVHRDLKCDNIFVDSGSGKITLGDLGLAKVLAKHGDAKKEAKTFVGTPTHMAPEFFDEGGRYDESVDIWAFGMCLIEMGTGEYPFSELSNKGQIFQKIANKELPEQQLAQLPPDAQRFARRCLQERSVRPTAAQLRQDPFFASSGPLVVPVSAQPAPSKKEPTAESERSSVLEFEFVLHHDDASDVISFEFHALKDDARTDAAQLVEALGLDFAPDAIADAIQEQVDWFKEHRYDEDYQHGVDNHIVVDIYAQETLVAPSRADLRESTYLRPQFQSPPVSLELKAPPDAEPIQASPFKSLWEGKLVGFQVARASETPSKETTFHKLVNSPPQQNEPDAATAEALPEAGTLSEAALPDRSPPKSPKRGHGREYSLSNYDSLAGKMLAGFSMETASEPRLKTIRNSDSPISAIRGHVNTNAKPIRNSAPKARRSRRSLEVKTDLQSRLEAATHGNYTQEDTEVYMSHSVPASVPSPMMYRMDSTTAMLLADDEEESPRNTPNSKPNVQI